MAGLVSGTLERSVRIGNARVTHAVEAPAATDAAPPEISDKDKVEEATTTADALADGSESHSTRPEPEEVDAEPKVDAATHEQPTSCRVCGRPLATTETFCGFCSMPR